MEPSFNHLIGEAEYEQVAAAPERYHQRLLRIFGWRFLIFLAFTQFLLKGLAITIASSVALPLFKDLLGTDASHLQLLSMIAHLPWSVKPVFGLLADGIRIGGYHNRYWLFTALMTGSLSAAALLLTLRERSVAGLVLCLMGVQFEICLYDLLTEGYYSGVMRDNPESGSDIVTLSQIAQITGSITALLFVGPLSDAGQFNVLFVILIGLCAAPLGPTVAGWLPERKHTEDRCCITLVPQNGRMVALIAFTGISAPIVTVLVNVWDPAVGAALALLLTSSIIVAAFFILPQSLARVALFQVVTTLSSPRLGSAMDYFYTAAEDCLPGGPHFSFAYYITVAGIIGSIASLLGALAYQLTLSKVRFRIVFVLTTLLSSATGASDLILVLRANIALGIPDAWAYIMGEAIMEPAIGMLNYIPMSTLLSKNVPRGMESSVFAFQAGLKNFAGLTSSLTGALIFDAAGVRTVLPCDWSSLWWLILLCHVALPALVGVPTAWLIPNKLQTEEL
jgi:hypothetical protein